MNLLTCPFCRESSQIDDSIMERTATLGCPNCLGVIPTEYVTKTASGYRVRVAAEAIEAEDTEVKKNFLADIPRPSHHYVNELLTKKVPQKLHGRNTWAVIYKHLQEPNIPESEKKAVKDEIRDTAMPLGLEIVGVLNEYMNSAPVDQLKTTVKEIFKDKKDDPQERLKSLKERLKAEGLTDIGIGKIEEKKREQTRKEYAKKRKTMEEAYPHWKAASEKDKQKIASQLIELIDRALDLLS